MMELGDTPEGEPIRAQVAVVGSGPAGTEVATFLAARGHQVVVLESGRAVYDEAMQALNDAEFTGRAHRVYEEGGGFHDYLPPELRGRNRIRQLGGTSTSWTGKWRVFEPRDFERRSWIPESGWPISFEDLRPFYAEVAADYALGIGGEDAQRDDRLSRDAEGFRGAGFKVVQYFQHRTAYRAVERLRAAEGPGLRILTDCTVTRITLAEGSDRVRALTCRAWGGAVREVEAEHVVLAAGGLETPRLLLASSGQHPAGLGNGHDLVGRFYQDHLKINAGKLRPGPLLQRHARAVQTGPKPRTMLCVGLPDAEQERLGVLEATLFFRPVYASWKAKVRNRLMGRRAWSDENGELDLYSVKYSLEQAANPRSRIKIRPRERDRMDMPRLEVDWQLTDLDRRSFEVSARELRALAERVGLGTLDLAGEPADMGIATDSAHHMGTTRMSTSAAAGVVDPHCTVWGHPNLHVASAAVFPTGAAYSPTYTIVALARRLGRRIDGLLAARPAVETIRRSA